MWSQEEKCLLWLDSFPIEPAQKHGLLRLAGGAVNLVKNFSAYTVGLDKEKALQMQETLQDGKYFLALKGRLEKESITPIFYGTEGYPEGWLGLSDAPLCLYAKGNVRLLHERKFAVVGSRKTTETGRKLGKKIAQDLASRFAVVTGSADGGDESALQGGLQGGKIICFLAGGFAATPKENPLLASVEKQGLLITACPYDTPVRVYSYEVRNKLLSALCEGVLVLGAAKRSGALITAKYAKEQGKKVFAIPYSPSVLAGEGCNALIKEGGFLTEAADDIWGQYGFTATKQASVSFTEMEQRLVDILKEKGELHAAEISKAAGIPIFKLTAVLSSLEVKGGVVKLGGNRYSAL